jgi:hypothetical protein
LEKAVSEFEAECRKKFDIYCQCYKVAAYHSLKRKYAAKAYAVIDAFLDFRDVQSL